MKIQSMKKLISMMLMVVLSFSMLVGCGNKETEKSESETSKVEVKKEDSGEDKEKDDMVAEETVTLEFWTWIPTDTQWDELYAAFREENPNIEIEYWRTSEKDDYLKKLQVAIASGTGPDLFGLQPGALVNQYASYVEPMDTYADTYMPDWKSVISQTAVEQSTSKEGVVAGMPLLLAGQEYMLYNETLMHECGVEEVPTTYEEMLLAVDKIKAAGKVPMAMGASDVWHDVDWFVAVSQQFKKGAIYEAEQGTLKWTDQVFVDTMQAWVDFFNDGVFEDGALGVSTYPDARDQYFYAREAVFFPTGSWHVSAVSKQFSSELPGTAVENDRIGMTSFIQVGPLEPMAVTGVDYILSVNAESEKKEAAAKFVEFMSKGTGQQLWINTLQGSPVANTISFTGEIDSDIAQESIDTINIMNNTSEGKRKLDYAEVETALGIAMQYAAAGEDIISVLEDVQAAQDGLKE